MEKALQLMISAVSPITDTIVKPLLQTIGCISASDIKSSMNVPPFAKSAMDGYAVFFDDIINASPDNPVKIDVLCEIDAGGFTDKTFKRGECARVMTGAYIPKDFDCVIKQEDTDMGEERVRIFKASKKYMNYCHIGEDITKDQIIIKKGSLITPFSIGAVASAGIAELVIRRPLKIAMISTGSELETPGKALADGMIYNSISYVLAAQIDLFGFECVYMKNVPDDEELLKKEFYAAISMSDVLVTTGGLSVGKKDIVGEVLHSIGAEKVFDKNDSPLGNPVIFSLVDKKPVLSLSGNPFASIANFDYYFRPLVARLMDSSTLMPYSERAVSENEYVKVRTVVRKLRGYCRNGRVSILANNKNSIISDLLSCNCFVELGAGKSIHIGDIVEVTYFGRKQWD